MKRNLILSIINILFVVMMFSCENTSSTISGNTSDVNQDPAYAGLDYLIRDVGLGIKYHAYFNYDEYPFSETIWMIPQAITNNQNDFLNVTFISEDYGNTGRIGAAYAYHFDLFNGIEVLFPYRGMNSRDILNPFVFSVLPISFDVGTEWSVPYDNVSIYYEVTSIEGDLVYLSVDASELVDTRCYGTGELVYKKNVGCISLDITNEEGGEYTFDFVETKTFLPVTVTGIVTSGGNPVEGYGVSPYSSVITSTTDSDGRYSFTFYGTDIRLFYGPVDDENFTPLDKVELTGLVEGSIFTYNISL